MSDIVYVAPTNGIFPTVVKIDGVCYELINKVIKETQALDIADEEFLTCDECARGTSSSSSGEEGSEDSSSSSSGEEGSEDSSSEEESSTSAIVSIQYLPCELSSESSSSD
jgi:hypothetical protein